LLAHRAVASRSQASSMTLRLAAFAAEASINYRRNVIEASGALPLRQMLTIAAKFIPA
jgi:hypothetical protein